jgi:hypothetical protein
VRAIIVVGSAAIEPQTGAKGERIVWLDPHVVAGLILISGHAATWYIVEQPMMYNLRVPYLGEHHATE